jgi:hypothetical protein
MVILRAIKEVGKSGEGYHLAKSKVIEVPEEEAERLQKAYPGCFKALNIDGRVESPAQDSEIIENEVNNG